MKKQIEEAKLNLTKDELSVIAMLVMQEVSVMKYLTFRDDISDQYDELLKSLVKKLEKAGEAFYE